MAPLDLTGISDADYDLAVYAGSELVWRRTHLRSSAYGDERGGLVYVGPCDASIATNRVELLLNDLYDRGGPVARTSYRNPTRPDLDGPTVPLGPFRARQKTERSAAVLGHLPSRCQRGSMLTGYPICATRST